MRIWDELLEILVENELIFFEVKIVSLEILTPYNFVGGHKCFVATYRLHLQKIINLIFTAVKTSDLIYSDMLCQHSPHSGEAEIVYFNGIWIFAML
jgi:hypothetical protein